MENIQIVLLIEAIANAWTKCLPAPYGTGEYSSAVDGATDCNRFTGDVAKQLGYAKFWDEENKQYLTACPGAISNYRVSLSAQTTVYFKSIGDFSSGNPKIRCRMSYRRAAH